VPPPDRSALIEELQHLLLGLNHLPTGCAVAAGYRPASDGFVGGDWYDAIPVAADQAGLIVGDVVGSGLAAVASMGQLRAGAAAAALADPNPARVMEVLDRLARHTLGGGYATAVYGLLDTKAERLDYCIAGHAPPMLVTPGGTVQVLDEGRRWPLGLEVLRSNRTASIAFPAGSLLFLYTDGLIERRGESMNLGLYRLRRALERFGHLPTSLVCDRLLETMFEVDAAGDDVAVLAVRGIGSTERSYADVIPGSSNELRAARRRLREWLELIDAPPKERDLFLLAMNEAISNSVVHGCQNDHEKQVTIEACLDNEALIGSVRDPGGWKADDTKEGEDRGLGLTIIRESTDDVDLKTTPDMTRTVIRLALRAPVNV